MTADDPGTRVQETAVRLTVLTTQPCNREDGVSEPIPVPLVATLAEMYVQSVSTRKVKAITEELCGHAFLSLRHQQAPGPKPRRLRQTPPRRASPLPHPRRPL
jgi:hypothetical protein